MSDVFFGRLKRVWHLQSTTTSVLTRTTRALSRWQRTGLAVGETRHIDVKHQMVRDAVDVGIIRVDYVKSGKQHADVLRQ